MPSVSVRATEHTLYELIFEQGNMMFRWAFFTILAVLFFAWLFSKRLPWVEKLGLTKLNSNVSFRAFGKARHIPITYVVLLATIVYWAASLAIALLYK
jgi:hypothetical protein